jgi:hypothetical protein
MILKVAIFGFDITAILKRKSTNWIFSRSKDLVSMEVFFIILIKAINRAFSAYCVIVTG